MGGSNIVLVIDSLLFAVSEKVNKLFLRYTSGILAERNSRSFSALMQEARQIKKVKEIGIRMHEPEKSTD